MRIILIVLFTITAGGLAVATKTSAAVMCGGAIGEAVAATAMVSKAKCRTVRRCSTFGCSYEQVCD